MSDDRKKNPKVPDDVYFFSTLIHNGYDFIARLVPETAPDKYISGYQSLSLDSPTTDTYAGPDRDDFLYCLPEHPVPFPLWGDVPEKGMNTLSIYGDYGILNYAEILAEHGIEHDFDVVYAANHYRAILDLVYESIIVASKGFLDTTIPLPTNQLVYDYIFETDKSLFLLDKISEMGPYLPEDRLPFLDRWIKHEKYFILNGYY